MYMYMCMCMCMCMWSQAPVDPMEPPKFKHKRVPRGPPSPPVPVMHSPPRKITAKDQQVRGGT